MPSDLWGPLTDRRDRLDLDQLERMARALEDAGRFYPPGGFIDLPSGRFQTTPTPTLTAVNPDGSLTTFDATQVVLDSSLVAPPDASGRPVLGLNPSSSPTLSGLTLTGPLALQQLYLLSQPWSPVLGGAGPFFDVLPAGPTGKLTPWLRVSNPTPFAWAGIKAPAKGDGGLLYVTNVGAGKFTLQNLAAGNSSSSSQVSTAAAADLALTTGQSALLLYDFAAAVWREIWRGISAADLPLSGVANGTYGDAAHYPVVTVDLAGRVTSISLQAFSGAGGPPTGAAGGDLNGTYPNPGVSQASVSDAATNAVTTALTLRHNTSGAPAAGYGVNTNYKLQDSAAADQLAAADGVSWVVATHGSATARRKLGVVGAGTTWEALRLEANATNALIGFLGALAVAQQTGDVGAALVAFGLMSGTPTFAYANLTGTLAAFVAAGGGHAAGGVPDPGATAHTNFPYQLLDAAAFGKPYGPMPSSLATNPYTANDETTTSASNVDLTTAQHWDFTLDETRTVMVMVQAQTYCSTVNSILQASIVVDGTQQSYGQEIADVANTPTPLVAVWSGSLASGAHTIKVQWNTSTGTGHFARRGIFVFLV